MSQPTPPNRSALRRRILLTVLILAVVAASTIYGLIQMNRSADEPAPPHTTQEPSQP